MTLLLATLPWLALLAAWALTRGVADELLVRLVPTRARRRAARARPTRRGRPALATARARGGLLLALGLGVRGPPHPARTRVP
jgi:hypothetical protein